MSVEALFITAITLLLMELFVPSAGLLTFGGFAAFCTGVTILLIDGAGEFYGLSIEVIIAIGLLIFITFATFGFYILKTYKRAPKTGIDAMIGKQAEVTSWSKTKGKIFYDGEDWQAMSNQQLNKGDIVTITDIKKMTLTVKKEN
jgi:membrane-bound serine protease (ClpP class)